MKTHRLSRFRHARLDVKVALDVASLSKIIVRQASGEMEIVVRQASGEIVARQALNESSLMRELNKDWRIVSFDANDQKNQVFVVLNDELTKSFFAARSINIDRFGLLSSAVERISNRKRKFSTHAQGSIFSQDYLETLSEGLEW